MLIHTYSHAIQFSGDLYGSLNSIHCNSALVLAKSNGGILIPGFIKKFVKVNTILKFPDDVGEKGVVDIYLAAINWLHEHPKKSWFIPPVEVWRKFCPCVQSDSFIPVTNIVCKCAYLVDTIKFSQILEDTVTIVVPVYNFAGLLLF